MPEAGTGTVGDLLDWGRRRLGDGHVDGHGDGHDDGYGDGHVDGHGDGHDDGYGDGHDDGHSDGHDDGHGDGHDDGHGDGHDDDYGDGPDDAMAARAESETLLGAVTGQSAAALIADAGRPVPDGAAREFQSLVERRARGEPVAYLLGEQEFWSLTLTVTPDVLIPRPETELLVEAALVHAARRSPATIVELGTGSGAVALALAGELPGRAVVATDISPAALEVAGRNARKLALEHVEFCLGDWLGAVPARRFDLIVANPPYVAPSDPHLGRGDLRFEPKAALVSGEHGLADLGRIIAAAPAALNTGGALFVEHGHDQGPAVRRLFRQNRFAGVSTRRDLGGHERVTGGEWMD